MRYPHEKDKPEKQKEEENDLYGTQKEEENTVTHIITRTDTHMERLREEQKMDREYLGIGGLFPLSGDIGARTTGFGWMTSPPDLARYPVCG